jgi:phosphoribosyl-ATP pyrophosphohydrolase
MNVTKLYNDVEKFNEIAGNFDYVDFNSIDNQIGFIFEELSETITAVENKDDVELLYGACDLFVTVAGLLQKLESAGFKVEEAMKRVNKNNLSKFAKSPKSAPEEAVMVIHHPEHNVYVFKNIDGKIIKPTNFVPVTLKDLAPIGFLEITQ